ncbi:hypothetical protein JK636_02290 [Clostridium sp. YIM B02515]|uniref:Erythromycin esterase family protein n=1 Tax=Clostridium rhizosphaerae TaxID=2803861 RepID=A0ABS1T744_9CLOT|nr:hypothetical protein [Clostridium rhizosphaerae]MBL4934582.1 hypothetical protein [Clostridium rhizosphaerae]
MDIKKKSIIYIFAAITITLLGIIISINSRKVKSADAYLNNNYKTVDFTEKGISSALKIIDDSNKYDILFTGEFHAIPGNETINLEMLKYLNKTDGVNYLICEMQYSVISKLNKYIQNGDEVLLKDAFNSVKQRNPKFAGDDYYKFWQELYEYNKSLPKDKKIQAFGIDVDFIGDYTIKEMSGLIPSKEPSKDISDKLTEFKKIADGKITDDKEAINIFKALNDDINSNKISYKAFFDNNFNDFKNNIDSMINTSKYAQIQDPNRDDLIYDNFMRIYSQNPKGKYYGQFGADHIFREDILSNGNAFYTLAKMLEKNNSFKVLSIPIAPSNRMELITQAQKLAQNRFSIFKLNGKGSPYMKQNEDIFTNNVFGIVNGTIVDNYQYVIYLKDK